MSLVAGGGQLVDLESDFSTEMASEVIYPLVLIKKVDGGDARLNLRLI